jgi:protein phosphatase
MLVCPQCQFDNPNHSLACEQCGTSLTDKPCPECGTSVTYDREVCPNCGANTAVFWWAVILSLGTQQIEDTEPFNTLSDLKTANTEASSEVSPAPSVSSLPNLNTASTFPYLDPGKRYCLMSDVDQSSYLETVKQNKSFQGKVRDCQPLHKSVLKVLLEEEELFLEKSGELDIDQDIKAILLHQIGIPELALPYLTLGEFVPVIPEIQDTWSNGCQEVILLSDRSDWHLLSEQFTQETLPSLQIIYWFNEMVRLWNPLMQLECAHSLLSQDNLRIDEDQIFGLQRLYADPPDIQPKLQDLGEIWQSLLQNSPCHQLESLEQLVAEVVHGKINTVTELRLQLQDLADAQQIALSKTVSENSEEDTKTLETGSQEDILLNNDSDEDLSTAVLPMQLHNFADAGATDVGRQRRHNEDHFGMDTQIRKQLHNRGQKVQAKGLYIICDGMGGHASGELASAMAVETLQNYFTTHWQEQMPEKTFIEQGILLANQTIFKINQEKESHGSGRMGTTLVLALVQDTKVAIAHVGDSRIYRVSRKWGLEQLTVDHEVGQRAIREGVTPKIAYSRPDAYQLTQALGPHDDQYVKPDIQYLEFNEDSLLLLCSDGLSDNKFIENNWQTCLIPLISSSTNLDEGINNLISLANQKNGHDNITAILIRIKVQPNLAEPLR